MNLNTLLGKYIFENHPIVDINTTHQETITYTEIHENIHMLLTQGSSYGLFINMIKKASLMDSSKNWLKEELVINMHKMQEATATAIEYLSIISREGIDKFRIEYSKLKVENKTYYKYLSDIKWIMEEVDDDSAENYIVLIKSIANISLQVNWKEVDDEAFESKKGLQRFLSSRENCLLYHPNVRFKTLAKIMKALIFDIEKVNNYT